MPSYTHPRLHHSNHLLSKPLHHRLIRIRPIRTLRPMNNSMRKDSRYPSNTPTNLHHRYPNTSSPRLRRQTISGLPVTGTGLLPVITGSPARGALHPTTALCGPPDTGVGIAIAGASTAATGAFTSASMVASTMASVTPAMATTAVIGMEITSITTGQSIVLMSSISPTSTAVPWSSTTGPVSPITAVVAGSLCSPVLLRLRPSADHALRR
jgi:hypothetical protein